MAFVERQLPGDGTLAAVFLCESCGHEMALLTNPMETQLVSSLGVKIGGRGVPQQPLELTRSALADARPDAFAEALPVRSAGLDREPHAEAPDADNGEVRPQAAPSITPGSVHWDVTAVERLARVPSFVRGMVKRIYADWAAERGIAVITPDVMDRARADLGLEAM
jgi:hypothetical protein